MRRDASVLITGASGMVGTALAERLLDGGADVTGVDVVENRWSDRVDDVTVRADLRDPRSVDDLPGDVDILVHLAANARVHELVKHPEMARDNFEMTFNVLEHARRNDVDVIFASSREVYGNNGKLVYSEPETAANDCESPYTASKIGGEALVTAYRRCYDLRTCTLRFSNVYGKYDVSDRVIPLFIAQTHRGEDLTVYGAEKVLDFTYLDDCIDGIVAAIRRRHDAWNTTFNIASGEGTSLVTLAEEVTDRIEGPSEIEIEADRTGEVGRYVADISRARKVLGYEPSYSFEEGIGETIRWYRENGLIDEIGRAEPPDAGMKERARQQ